MSKYTAKDAIDIVAAIKRSISHNEIVHVTVPSLAEGKQWVSERSESCASVETEDNQGLPILDIWGDDGQGGEFRLELKAQ